MQTLPKIQRESLRDQVAELIRQAISDGSYPPGSKIPSEQSLAQQLGVGRSSVREALEHLVALGLVVRQPGRGVFVAQPQDFAERAMDSIAPQMLLNPPSMRWLLEVRQVVEPRVAAMAARRATKQDLEELAAIVSDLEAQRYEPDSYARTDLLFHRRIMQASGNMLFPRILNTIHSLFIRELEITVRAPGATDRSFAFHRRILEALLARDSEAAEFHMSEHLRDVEKQLVEVRPPKSVKQSTPTRQRRQAENEG